MKFFKGALLGVICCFVCDRLMGQEVSLLPNSGNASYTFRADGRSVIIDGGVDGKYSGEYLELGDQKLRLVDNRSNLVLADKKYTLRRYQDRWVVSSGRLRLFSISYDHKKDELGAVLNYAMLSSDGGAGDEVVRIAAALIVRERLMDDVAAEKAVDPVLLAVISSFLVNVL